MAKHAQLELDNQLCFPLYAASRAMTRAYLPLLEPFDLTYPQYLTMLAVWSGPEAQTVGELGARLRLDSGTLTPLLKRLEARGLVERHRDPDDERRVLVSATAEGSALQDELADVPLSLATRTGLTLEDGIEFRRLLDALLTSLDRHEETPA
ncbi:MAG: MarR family transcriptional regulator [Ilumatobacter fluminis]|uniref:MarR family winged helix-turn-helix transcriptional regulator n=1 Tax=Ilumatobacter fluminis TaxID=467091 RepID=UPI0032EDBFAA